MRLIPLKGLTADRTWPNTCQDFDLPREPLPAREVFANGLYKIKVGRDRSSPTQDRAIPHKFGTQKVNIRFPVPDKGIKNKRRGAPKVFRSVGRTKTGQNHLQAMGNRSPDSQPSKSQGLKHQVIVSKYATMNKIPVIGLAGKILESDSPAINSSNNGSIMTKKDRSLFQKLGKVSPGGGKESLVRSSRFAPLDPSDGKNRVLKIATPKNKFLDDASIRMENQRDEIGMRK
jgi:hypothetical protein